MSTDPVSTEVAQDADPRATIVEDITVVESFDGGVRTLTLSHDPAGAVDVLDRARGHMIGCRVHGRQVTKPGFFGHGRDRFEVTYDVAAARQEPEPDDERETARFFARSAGLDPDTLDESQPAPTV
jgi:hypothetical protein